MAFKRLFIFVEGPDDSRFFENVIQPALKGSYDLIELVEYAKLRHNKVSAFLKSIESMNADYVFVADINKPCITARKQDLQSKYQGLDGDKIRVVRVEIEGWYLAGLNNPACKRLKIRPLRNTDSTSKEEFERLMPSKFDSRKDFMIEVLKYFSIEVAKEKNASFRYFADKHGC